jgi:outer membrane lipopolysaccharide assembly protein LptE/RlpB
MLSKFEYKKVKVLSMKFLDFLKMALLLSFFSCVYSFSSGSFGGTLFISTLENETQNPDIGRILTEGLINAFISDGRVKIAKASEGDYILEGVINGYDRQPQSYTPEGEIEEYRLTVSANFSLKQREKEKNEWDKPINESFVYPSDFDELSAVDSVAAKVKNSLLRLMLEDW